MQLAVECAVHRHDVVRGPETVVLTPALVPAVELVGHACHGADGVRVVVGRATLKALELERVLVAVPGPDQAVRRVSPGVDCAFGD